TLERIQILRRGPVSRALPMGLQRALDLLHERSVLQHVQRFLLPLPVLGADDHEVLPPAPPDPQGDVIHHHLLDRFPQMAAELMNGDLSHGPKCTESGTTSRELLRQAAALAVRSTLP